MANDYRPWEKVDVSNAQTTINKFDAEVSISLSQSIGRVLIAWSTLESSIQTFLNELLALRADYFLATVGQLDIYQKMNSLHAITIKNAPNELWSQHISELNKYIDGTLRNERNRIAHDTWFIDEGTPQSINFKTSVNRKTNEPNYFVLKDRDPKDIDVICTKIIICASLVKRLRDLYHQDKLRS